MPLAKVNPVFSRFLSEKGWDIFSQAFMEMRRYSYVIFLVLFIQMYLYLFIFSEEIRDSFHKHIKGVCEIFTKK